jgi:hypothetical protein
MKKIIMLLILGIFVIATILFLKNLFFPDDQSTLYGSRLDGIEEYSIDNLEEVTNAFKSMESVDSTNVRIQGRTINITVVLAKEVTNIKEQSFINIKLFKEEVLNYYDIQVFVNTTEETENYPIIGYKNNDSESLVWTY